MLDHVIYSYPELKSGHENHIKFNLSFQSLQNIFRLFHFICFIFLNINSLVMCHLLYKLLKKNPVNFFLLPLND